MSSITRSQLTKLELLTNQRSLTNLSLIVLAICILSVSVRPLVAQNEMQRRDAGQNNGQQKAKKKRNRPPRLPNAVRQSATPPYTAVAVNKSDRRELIATAAKIDRAVESILKKEGLRPNDRADDGVFLRRAYLTIAGRIPSLKETEEFLGDKSESKRFDLIDKLISSPDYVSHSFNYWASVLRIKDYPRGNLFLMPYREWVKSQIAANRPFDELVYDMLTAEGKVWENPAAGYTIRDFGMPLVHVDNTVRVFLGTQVGCAQCHDHPFDNWTQQEFYKLAAFTHATVTRDNRQSPSFKKGNPIQRIRRELTEQGKGRQAIGKTNRLMNANVNRVSTMPKRKLRLPKDYAYDDAKPRSLVKPDILWGEIPSSAANLSLREQYAAWMTGVKNERFAMTIVNRMWKRAMGRGLIEPIDNFMDDTDGPYLKLLQALSEDFVRHDFDIQRLYRLIHYTGAYQSEAGNFDPNVSTEYHFVGPMLRRMSAEQIWDSIMTLAVRNPYVYETPDAEDYARYADVDLANASAKEVLQKAEEFESNLGRRTERQRMKPAIFRGIVLARASELPQPVPPSHFLQQFGQSSREAIEDDSTDATTPQALAMFNGPITHMVLEEGSVIYDDIVNAKSQRSAVDRIFLAVLQRKPTRVQKKYCGREVEQRGVREAFGNIVWALINTREFIFIQ